MSTALVATRAQLLGWIVAAALVALAVGAALGGWAGHRYASAQGEARVGTLQAEYARERAALSGALATAAESMRLALAAEAAQGNHIVTQLRADKAAIAAERDTLQRRVRHVTQSYQPAPGAALLPAPRCVVTVGWVRDYNAAIGAAVPGADPAAAGGGAGGAADSAAAADAGLLLDSGVSLADVLAHVIDHGAHCRTIAAQTAALIDRWEARR